MSLDQFTRLVAAATEGDIEQKSLQGHNRICSPRAVRADLDAL
jgi:hypothetical protein